MLWSVHKAMRRVTLFVLFVMSSSLPAQQAPVGREGTPTRTGPVMGERDQASEDQIAKLFETMRSDAKVEPLSRIKHRDRLEQEVCTSALLGTLPKAHSPKTSAFYTTVNPETVSAELRQVALFNDLHSKYNWSIERYSIAVWKVKIPQTAETTFWVGLQLYWSAGTEFFDTYFTDDIYRRNEWKKWIAPQCREK
jgi:hypothetical protein